MNKKLIILLTLLIILAPCYKVYAEGTNENNLDQAVNDVIEGMDLTPLEDWLHKIFNVENVKEVIVQAIIKAIIPIINPIFLYKEPLTLSSSNTSL